MALDSQMDTLGAASAACADVSAPDAGSGDLAALRSDTEMAELFISEALDHLGTIESALLALDQRPGDTALLDDIFRPFHTLKGNAAALGVTSVQEFAHRVENLLDLVRSGHHRLGPAEVDIILRAVDVAKMMIGSLAQQLKGQPPLALGDAAAVLIGDAERLMLRHASVTAAPVVALPAVAAASAEPALLAGMPWDNITIVDRSDALAGDGTARASIKVDTRKLDDLVDTIGELITVQSLIDEDPALSNVAEGRLARHLAKLKRITADLQRNAMALRMVPIRQAFQKAARAVHDSSRRADKSVELVLAGEDIELDRTLVEQITDPLMHMVRNGVDHGIEMAEARIACGKPAQGRLSLAAYHQGGRIVIEVADDGAGLQTERILARAVERGLVPAGTVPAPEQIHQLVFEPGFSTVDQVTEMSGRGVGMDVVKRNVEALRGRIEIRSEAGRGTSFTISLPLTFAALDALLVAVGRERLVLPSGAVRETLQPAFNQVVQAPGQPRRLQLGDARLPLVFLSEMFGAQACSDLTGATVVVVEHQGTRVGLVVDEALGRQEVVIRSLGDAFAGARGVAGGAILSDGRIGLILDVHGIVARTVESGRA